MKKFQYFFPLFLQKIGYVVFLLLYKLFVKIEIRGRENIKNLKSPIILASNHTSELDSTAMFLIPPFFSTKLSPIYTVANPQEKYNTFGWRNYIYGGVFFNMLGAYSVYSGHKDYAVALEDHIRLLGMGRSVFIFPEGKRTDDGKLGSARGGLGYLVFVTNIPVLPIAIDTFFNISARDFFFFKRKVVITILPLVKAEEIISTDNPTVQDFRNASQKIIDKIQNALN